MNTVLPTQCNCFMAMVIVKFIYFLEKKIITNFWNCGQVSVILIWPFFWHISNKPATCQSDTGPNTFMVFQSTLSSITFSAYCKKKKQEIHSNKCIFITKSIVFTTTTKVDRLKNCFFWKWFWSWYQVESILLILTLS